jgi:hypothetical protein
MSSHMPMSPIGVVAAGTACFSDVHPRVCGKAFVEVWSCASQVEPPPAYRGLLERPEPANQRRRNILARQAYSETTDWPLRDLSRAVVCGSVRISSKKPSSLS